MNTFLLIAPHLLLINLIIIVSCLLIEWVDVLYDEFLEKNPELRPLTYIAWTMRIEIPSDSLSTFAKKSRSTPQKT